MVVPEVTDRESWRSFPTFGVPWLTNVQLRIDWLHCADQGVAADALGNIFKALVGKVDGRKRSARVANKWDRVLAFFIVTTMWLTDFLDLPGT